MTHTIGILLFDDVEVLDFAGPYEVFTTASRVYRRLHPDAAVPFKVVTLASARCIRARAGLVVEADHFLDNHPPLDIVIVPGGDVTDVMLRSDVTAWLRSVAARSLITASVCTGAFLMAKAGLLDDRSVTTHWEDQADLQAMYPNIQVVAGQRWIDEGAVVTSGGIAAGIDMSLHLVSRLTSPELAAKTARQMEVDWQCSPAA